MTNPTIVIFLQCGRRALQLLAWRLVRLLCFLLLLASSLPLLLVSELLLWREQKPTVTEPLVTF